VASWPTEITELFAVAQEMEPGLKNPVGNE
jgi:hypothetical protein